jgi:hypothetical protein
MKKSILFSLKASGLAFAILLVITIGVAYAAPMPPRTLINHKTHQCAQITPGDECGDVILPPDWQYLDTSAGEKCPDDYKLVDLQLKWMHFKSQLCCSEGHSGSRGDCQDVVTQPTKRQCAFVEDIQKCPNLPEGWKAWGQNCPNDFYWTSEVVCTGNEAGQATNGTGGNQTGPTAFIKPSETPPANPAKPTGAPERRNPLFPCASSGLALMVLCSAVLRRR